MSHVVRVLLVDDDDDVRETMVLVLERAGYRVESASNGREAFTRIDQGGRPDLILLDLMMPVMDGWEFRRIQRERADLADVPVVVLSAGDRTPDGVSVLQKPVTLDGLLAAICRAAGALSPPVAKRLARG